MFSRQDAKALSLRKLRKQNLSSKTSELGAFAPLREIFRLHRIFFACFAFFAVKNSS
jgi:hypothetical protein